MLVIMLWMDIPWVQQLMEAFNASDGCPKGTTINASFNASDGRPKGTTMDAGFNASDGRPKGTTLEAGFMFQAVVL